MNEENKQPMEGEGQDGQTAPGAAPATPAEEGEQKPEGESTGM